MKTTAAPTTLGFFEVSTRLASSTIAAVVVVAGMIVVASSAVAWDGIARLYHGERNLLDVVTGAALGTAFATVLWFVLLNREVPEAHR